MTLRFAPQAALAPTSPAVGIFWRVGDALIVDRSTLDVAELYGDCVTHAGGHYERWEEWKALNRLQLISAGYPEGIASSEYDEWPRGRIVYEKLKSRFVIYADRRLQEPTTINLLRAAFGLLDQEVIVKSDLHYR